MIGTDELCFWLLKFIPSIIDETHCTALNYTAKWNNTTAPSQHLATLLIATFQQLTFASIRSASNSHILTSTSQLVRRGRGRHSHAWFRTRWADYLPNNFNRSKRDDVIAQNDNMNGMIPFVMMRVIQQQKGRCSNVITARSVGRQHKWSINF